MTIVYHKDFCLKLSSQFIDVAYDKYALIMNYFLLIDEMVYLLTEEHLFKDKYDIAEYKRYAKVVTDCNANFEDIDKCKDFCKEFNVNKFNYMFDGESQNIDEYIEGYVTFMDKTINMETQEGRNILFKRFKWDTTSNPFSFDIFKDTHSVISTYHKGKKFRKHTRANSFDLHFKS